MTQTQSKAHIRQCLGHKDHICAKDLSDRHYSAKRCISCKANHEAEMHAQRTAAGKSKKREFEEKPRSCRSFHCKVMVTGTKREYCAVCSTNRMRAAGRESQRKLAAARELSNAEHARQERRVMTARFCQRWADGIEWAEGKVPGSTGYGAREPARLRQVAAEIGVGA